MLVGVAPQTRSLRVKLTRSCVAPLLVVLRHAAIAPFPCLISGTIALFISTHPRRSLMGGAAQRNKFIPAA